jgi:hypothetical protein
MKDNKPINRIHPEEEKLFTRRKINEIVDRLNELEVKLGNHIDDHADENLIHMKILRGDMAAAMVNAMDFDDQES